MCYNKDTIKKERDNKMTNNYKLFTENGTITTDTNEAFYILVLNEEGLNYFIDLSDDGYTDFDNIVTTGFYKYVNTNEVYKKIMEADEAVMLAKSIIE